MPSPPACRPAPPARLSGSATRNTAWGDRLVVSADRLEVKADRLEVKAGRMVRQAGTKSRNRQGSKPGGLAKENRKSRRTGKPLVDLETYKTNWHRETGNTGINTLGKISNTWRGW